MVGVVWGVRVTVGGWGGCLKLWVGDMKLGPWVGGGVSYIYINTSYIYGDPTGGHPKWARAKRLSWGRCMKIIVTDGEQTTT